MPRPGLPEAIPNSRIVAIRAARSTLGSGVTSTTNPSRVSSESAIRMPRRSPRNAVSSMTPAITTAQFAPETAVRWLSELVFMAASRSASTALVSPIARPGSRSPPSPGRPPAAAMNWVRNSPAQPSHQGGVATGSGGPRPNTRADAASPAVVSRRVASSRTTLPSCSMVAAPCAVSENTTTGTDSPCTTLPCSIPPCSIPVRVPRKRTRAGTPELLSAGPNSAGVPNDWV